MKSNQVYREAYKNKTIHSLFDDSRDQKNLIINFERRFLNILGSYVNNQVDDIHARRKLCSLLNDLSIASDPFLIDEEMLEDVFNLEVTIKEVLFQLNQNSGWFLRKIHNAQ